MINIRTLVVIIFLIAFISFFTAAGECAVKCVGMPSGISQWQQCETAQDCIVTKGDCGQLVTFNAIFIKEEAQYALCKPPVTTCTVSPDNRDVNDVKADCVKNKCIIPLSNQ